MAAAAAAAVADTATKYVASNLPATTGTYTNLTVAFLGVHNLAATITIAKPVDSLMNSPVATISSTNTTTAT